VDTDAKKLVKELRERVIEWEKEHWISYPWRVNRTPYRVLIAEILLKRTTRQAVSREFPKFITKFPNIKTVYGASVDEIGEAFKHLGLYKQRAMHLKQLAEQIVEKYGDKIPSSWDELIKLPGVGPYLAGAVMSFGYGKKAPVADSNAVRLLSKLMGLNTKKAEDYVNILWKLVPENNHEYFNYGLIDLGALVCHYKEPRCKKCVLNDLCVFFLDKIGKKEQAEELRKTYFLIRDF